jgi:hypothetical protein
VVLSDTSWAVLGARYDVQRKVSSSSLEHNQNQTAKGCSMPPYPFALLK